MHLLHTTKLELQEFIGDDIPRYAILSHTWGDGEVLFRHVWEKKFPLDASAGSSKIRNACARAVKDGWKYIWVDTCCINKESSAELSEAINSMYQWYKASEVCYVYLSDVSPSAKKLKESRWFTRGWTLQELLAPELVEFYDRDWYYLACKDLRDEAFVRNVREVYRDKLYLPYPEHPNAPVSKALSFLDEIAKVTFVAVPCLAGIYTASVAQKMSWVARRQTKRGEDMAYCMLGLFDVNMPLLYGEGKTKAFFRLQSEILKISYDDSLFAWNNPDLWSSGLLAHSPYDFIDCSNVESYENISRISQIGEGLRRPPSLTSLGVEMTIPITNAEGHLPRIGQISSIRLNCHIGADKSDEYFNLNLNVQFIGHAGENLESADKTGLTTARRTHVARFTPEHPTLHGEIKRQVFFPQTTYPKSSSWQNLQFGGTSWTPAYDELLDVAPPTVNVELGHALKNLTDLRFYQDLSHLRKRPQHIRTYKGRYLTLLPKDREHPCGLILALHTSYLEGFHHIFLRWRRNHGETLSIEILHLKNYDPDDEFSHGVIQLSPKDHLALYKGNSVSSNGRSDGAIILSRNLLVQGDVYAYDMRYVGHAADTLWVSLLDPQRNGDNAEWTMEIDMTGDR